MYKFDIVDSTGEQATIKNKQMSNYENAVFEPDWEQTIQVGGSTAFSVRISFISYVYLYVHTYVYLHHNYRSRTKQYVRVAIATYVYTVCNM